MKPKLTLAEAKEMSLTKWRGIKAALPDVKLDSDGQPDEAVYGECGFCLYYGQYYCVGISLHPPNAEDCGEEGQRCVLYPRYCVGEKDEAALYWRICDKLLAGKAASEDIDEMIAVIEAVEV